MSEKRCWLYIACITLQEAKAFLVFLEETMCSDTSKHEEFMLQFSCVSRLLNDLAVLVEDYERATSILLR